jgi:large subunit ribosomal protein L9
MQVILLENIIKLGNIGDLVEVKNGYGRNFLLKTGKALRASKENIALVGKTKDELNKKNNEIKIKFKELKDQIDKKVVKFNKEAKESGDLFATIKPKEISTYIVNNFKVEVKPSQIELNQEINKTGKYQIKINLHSEVSASINIVVDKIESN